jgi:hypothetical protein
VSVTNLPTVQSVSVSPADSFSYVASTGATASGTGSLRGPDPAGTRYAISGVVLTSTSNNPAWVTIRVVAGNASCEHTATGENMRTPPRTI